MVIISKEYCKPSSKIAHTLPGLATVYKNLACNFSMHKCKAEIYFNKDFFCRIPLPLAPDILMVSFSL